MKYQKSTLKIMENLLYSRQEKTIEQIIKETKTGRNSAFDSIKLLKNQGTINIRASGNQKLVSLIIDNYTLQFKYYLDSIAFKSLDPFVKLVLQVFISKVDKIKIKAIVLFGSVLKKGNFNDIDILLLGNLDLKFIESLSVLREKIERTFGVIINLHKEELNVENMFRGIAVYQTSYIDFRNNTKEQYLEFFDRISELIRNKKSLDFQTAFDNSVLNLAYAYCYMNDFAPLTKADANDFFKKKYKTNNLANLKKIGVEIGKELFK